MSTHPERPDEPLDEEEALNKAIELLALELIEKAKHIKELMDTEEAEDD